MKETLEKIVVLIGERFDVGVDATTEMAIEDILENALAEQWSEGFDVGHDKGQNAGWDLCQAQHEPDMR